MIKITHKRRPGTELSPLILNGKAAGQAGRDKKIEVGPTVESAKADVSKETREAKRILQRLACKGDRLLAGKVRQVKEMVAKGEYKIDPREVARSIVRTEISWQLDKSRVQSMNIDLMELLAIREKEIAARKEWQGNAEDQKKVVPAWDVVALSQPIYAEPNLASPTFSGRRSRC